ncbi:uncharacterized protein N7503_011199 [Penicillium pulvis]|uniref:uncharacterized protein n=1 Tax=Penicillium pulvis TaxID=1562058 RepID=UPI002546E9FB|nr:uncharacterized protein N7503_011199 [Penicillium pulvis]KAJ5785987.1 hypothetical protein N7503_011199 [Penicillium pulvis]
MESSFEEAGGVHTEGEIRKAFVIPDVDESDFSMQCPFLHAFHFSRLAIDVNYADVKSIACHPGVLHGVDDDADVPSHNAKLKANKTHLTRVEKFLIYQVFHGNDWYQNRHRHAQRFLDQFACQNVAIEKIFR